MLSKYKDGSLENAHMTNPFAKKAEDSIFIYDEGKSRLIGKKNEEVEILR